MCISEQVYTHTPPLACMRSRANTPSRSLLHMCIYTYVYIHTYICMHIHIRTHTSFDLRETMGKYAFKVPSTYDSVYIHMYLHTHMYIHTYIHTQTSFYLHATTGKYAFELAMYIYIHIFIYRSIYI